MPRQAQPFLEVISYVLRFWLTEEDECLIYVFVFAGVSSCPVVREDKVSLWGTLCLRLAFGFPYVPRFEAMLYQMSTLIWWSSLNFIKRSNCGNDRSVWGAESQKRFCLYILRSMWLVYASVRYYYVSAWSSIWRNRRFEWGFQFWTWRFSLTLLRLWNHRESFPGKDCQWWFVPWFSFRVFAFFACALL